MHTPTSWVDYPLTTTQITAAEMLRIDSLACAGYDFVDYILDKVISASAHEKSSLTVEAGSTLLPVSGRPYCAAPSGVTEGDGLIIRKNGVLLRLTDYGVNYLSGTITFYTQTFAENDRITFDVYKNYDLPDDYQQQALTFNGSRAISTLIAPSVSSAGSFRVEAVITPRAYTNGLSSLGMIIGGFGSSPYDGGIHNTIQLGFIGDGGTNNGKLGAWARGAHGTSERYALTSASVSLNVPHTIAAEFSSTDISLTVDGVTTSATNVHSIPARDVWIGANGNPQNAGDVCYGVFDLSWIKLFVDGAIVGDFIPVKRTSDSATGLYDRVRQDFYD